MEIRKLGDDCYYQESVLHPGDSEFDQIDRGMKLFEEPPLLVSYETLEQDPRFLLGEALPVMGEPREDIDNLFSTRVGEEEFVLSHLKDRQFYVRDIQNLEGERVLEETVKRVGSLSEIAIWLTQHHETEVNRFSNYFLKLQDWNFRFEREADEAIKCMRWYSTDGDSENLGDPDENLSLSPMVLALFEEVRNRINEIAKRLETE